MIMSNQWDQKARRRNQNPEEKNSMVVPEWLQINCTYNSFYNTNVNLQKQLGNILKVLENMIMLHYQNWRLVQDFVRKQSLILSEVFQYMERNSKLEKIFHNRA